MFSKLAVNVAFRDSLALTDLSGSGWGWGTSNSHSVNHLLGFGEYLVTIFLLFLNCKLRFRGSKVQMSLADQRSDTNCCNLKLNSADMTEFHSYG